MRIMIVEDNALVAMSLELQLVDSGHEVVGIAATESEALEIGRAQHPDLVLMDVALADGSNGVDAAAHLKKELQIDSVFMTATLPDRPDVQRYGLGHLSKPFSEQDLVLTVEIADAIRRGGVPPPPPTRLTLFP